MRFALLGLLALASCGASEVKSQRLEDGSWKFTCELAMDECIRRVQTNCRNHRFRIIEGTSEVRLRDASPYEKAYHTSNVHLMCTDLGSDVLVEVGAKKDGGSCAKGETRACIGAGACKGGQACLPDGSGFGSCDCGDAAGAASAPPATTAPPPADTAAPAPGDPGAPGAAGGPGAPPLPAP
jgi:hypothetical protein